jgi:type III restriction enzyme
MRCAGSPPCRGSSTPITGLDQPEYVPDFVAATPETNLLIETKRAGDVQTEEVQTKAHAAMQWCEHASTYARQHGTRPWKYLLIPHDEVVVNATLAKLAVTFDVRQRS